MVRSPAAALRRTHEWFGANSGWAPPDPGTLAEWMADGACRCPDECLVLPSAWCAHGLASWWLVLRSLDRAEAPEPLPPERLVPHPDRLDPGRTDYVAILDAHHQALVRGEAGYLDPATGLFVQTARSLADRRGCCSQGCRHCPYLER